MRQYLYLVVEADEFELPLAVYDTAKALCKDFGMSYSNLFKYIDLGRNYHGVRFYRVRTDDV